jgi:ribosomal protein S18 acetylase RimI-like enzyme
MRTAGSNQSPGVEARAAHPLDNAVWNALVTRQAHFAEGDRLARCFPHDVTALAGLAEVSAQAWDALAELPSAAQFVVLFLDAPVEPPAGWKMLEQGMGVEMVHEVGHAPLPSAASERIVELTPADSPEMFALAKSTQPGPFGLRTHELGTYLGIRQGGELIAMAGERLRLPGFTEVSAVCTHPDHTGRGYAAALVSALVENVHRRGEVPFLHARDSNTRAIDLYRRLGFQQRRLFHFGVVRRTAA